VTGVFLESKKLLHDEIGGAGPGKVLKTRSRASEVKYRQWWQDFSKQMLYGYQSKASYTCLSISRSSQQVVHSLILLVLVTAKILHDHGRTDAEAPHAPPQKKTLVINIEIGGAGASKVFKTRSQESEVKYCKWWQDFSKQMLYGYQSKASYSCLSISR